MLAAQTKISAQIAAGNEMEEWYVYRQLPWVRFHLIFQTTVLWICPGDKHYFGLNRVIKVMINSTITFW
ncbi:hypothetical protein IFR05_016971 [Cadophora sp. M221]|nr:hypothetical protein IFR05_016971 [Cadophora sp. M221]